MLLGGATKLGGNDNGRPLTPVPLYPLSAATYPFGGVTYPPGGVAYPFGRAARGGRAPRREAGGVLRVQSGSDGSDFDGMRVMMVESSGTVESRGMVVVVWAFRYPSIDRRQFFCFLFVVCCLLFSLFLLNVSNASWVW